MRRVLRDHTTHFCENIKPWMQAYLDFLYRGGVIYYNYITTMILAGLFGLFVEDDKTSFRIRYFHNNEWCWVVLPHKSPKPITFNVYNSAGVSVLEDLISKGLAYKFRNVPTTPKMLGYNYLKFVLFDDEFEIQSDDLIPHFN